MEIVGVDDKGRMGILKSIRRKAEVKERSHVSVEVKEKNHNAASKYYGAFKIVKWPEDLDEFLIEAVKKWWRQKTTQTHNPTFYTNLIFGSLPVSMSILMYFKAALTRLSTTSMP